MAEPLSDPDIRSALLATWDKWYCKGFHVFSELGLEWGSAIFDVAVLGERIDGYEIKSDKDSLSRLPNQVRLFSEVADLMTIVTVQRHLKKCVYLVPDWWGVTLAKRIDGNVELLRIREADWNPNQNAASLLRLMWKSEIAAFLTKHGHSKINKRLAKDKLAEEAVKLFAIDDIRSEVLRCVKSRKKERRIMFGADQKAGER